MNVDLFDTVYDGIEKGIFDLVCFSVLKVILIILQSLKFQKLDFIFIKMA